MIGTLKQILKFILKNWYKKDAIFEIKQKREKTLRSIAQNRYYFGIIIKEISNFHGYTPIETHELLKLTFNLETTTNLDTKEFKDMADIIRDYWNTKFGVYIPLPNEVEELKSLEAFLF